MDPQASTLSDTDFARFSRLLQDQCGLFFSAKRRVELELGVRHAFASSTCKSLDDYYDLLTLPRQGAVEMDRLINSVTIAESHFFRDEAQMNALTEHVLPSIIERRRLLRTMRLWSAGCASGEEPYTLAILLRELLPDVDEWAITILATDINTEVLDRARHGQYSEWAFRETRAKLLRSRYFTTNGSRYELLPEVRRMVTFSRLNLAGDRYPLLETNTTMMDLILCRNVLIYFDEAGAQQVINHFYDAMLDGSWLVVGHSEPSVFNYRRFQARNFRDAILYQRTGQPTLLPHDWEILKPSTGPIGAATGAATGTTTPTGSGSQPPPVWAPPASKPLAPLRPVKPVTLPPIKEPDPIEQAEDLIHNGRSTEALPILLKAAEKAPNARACVMLGQLYADLGQWADAERWCKRAAELDRLAIEAYYIVALVYQHQNRLVEAIDAMKKVVYIDRNSILGHFGLADLYHRSGQNVPALKSLDNARRLLDAHAVDELIPGSGGITVGRLRETVVMRLQEWNVH